MPNGLPNDKDMAGIMAKYKKKLNQNLGPGEETSLC